MSSGSSGKSVTKPEPSRSMFCFMRRIFGLVRLGVGKYRGVDGFGYADHKNKDSSNNIVNGKVCSVASSWLKSSQ